jgi:Tol biopolymer transport system component
VVLATILGIGIIARFTIGDTGVVRPPAASFAHITSEPGVEDSPSLSPDGEWVVYAGDGDGDRDIFLRSTGGQRVIPLTGDSPADDSQPALSRQGDRIAFRSSRDGGGIFVMARTGEGVRRVTNTGFNPAWSHDGRHLVYGMESVGLTPLNGQLRSELWVVPVTAGAARRVSAGDRDALDPSWSPNGHRIAYTNRQMHLTTDSARMDIETIPASGGEAVRVTHDAFADWSPVWSGDGRHLYFVSNRGGSMNLWRVRIDEKSGRVQGAPESVAAPGQFVAHPSVSADGRVIAFSNVVTTAQNIQKATFDPVTGTLSEHVWLTMGTRRWANPDPTATGDSITIYSQDRPEGDLYLIRGDGSGLQRLTEDSAIDRVPRWSPDGSRIAYFSARAGPLSIWTIRPDGSDNRQVGVGDTSVPTWSPDGSRIAGNTMQRTVVIFDPLRAWNDQDVEWLPVTPLGRFTATDWSPDGQHLAGTIDYRDTGIVTYSLRSRTYEKLTDFGEWPVWLPDSRRLLFVSGTNAFFILDVQTRNVRQVYASPWDIIGPPRLTRDARQIFFSRRVTEGDIWLATLQ